MVMAKANKSSPFVQVGATQIAFKARFLKQLKELRNLNLEDVQPELRHCVSQLLKSVPVKSHDVVAG